MTADSLRGALGRRVVSTADAEPVGTVDHVVLDARRRVITGIVIGGGKKALVVDWSEITGFGPDAVMVAGGARAPLGDAEMRAADGGFDVLGRRTLSHDGNEVGSLGDLTFDPSTGELAELRVGDRVLPATALLSVGSYAVVVTDAGG